MTITVTILPGVDHPHTAGEAGARWRTALSEKVREMVKGEYAAGAAGAAETVAVVVATERRKRRAEAEGTVKQVEDCGILR